MGPAQSSLLGLGATVGVAASKISQGIGELKAAQISEANDADKNELMAQRAKMNAEKLKNLKLRNKKLRLQNKALKDKQILKKEENPNE
jgi:hypothetical protein